jgi:hypothetical protein
MPTTTAIPAAKEAVRRTLAEAASLEGTTVATGKEPTRPRQYIWVVKASAKRDWGSLGQRRRKEKLSVTMRVVAIGADDVEARAYELCSAAEVALLENLQLNGQVVKNLVEELDEEPSLDFDGKPGHAVWMTVVADTTL